MAAEKQSDVKGSPVGQKKEGASDGGLGLESILYGPRAGASFSLSLRFTARANTS